MNCSLKPAKNQSISEFGFVGGILMVKDKAWQRVWARGGMADARGLGPREETLAGSSPVAPTKSSASNNPSDGEPVVVFAAHGEDHGRADARFGTEEVQKATHPLNIGTGAGLLQQRPIVLPSGVLLSVNPSGPARNGQIVQIYPSEKRKENVHDTSDCRLWI